MLVDEAEGAGATWLGQHQTADGPSTADARSSGTLSRVASSQEIFVVGQCPVDIFEVVALRAEGAGIVFHGPCCGLAWMTPPAEGWPDSDGPMLSLLDVAPSGVRLPSWEDLGVAGVSHLVIARMHDDEDHLSLRDTLDGVLESTPLRQVTDESWGGLIVREVHVHARLRFPMREGAGWVCRWETNNLGPTDITGSARGDTPAAAVDHARRARDTAVRALPAYVQGRLIPL